GNEAVGGEPVEDRVVRIGARCQASNGAGRLAAAPGERRQGVGSQSATGGGGLGPGARWEEPAAAAPSGPADRGPSDRFHDPTVVPSRGAAPRPPHPPPLPHADLRKARYRPASPPASAAAGAGDSHRSRSTRRHRPLLDMLSASNQASDSPNTWRSTSTWPLRFQSR